jgi:hypothetical protein
MDSRSILTAFNNHFLEFVKDIQVVFPDDTDIATVYNAFTKIRKANPKLIIIAFKEHVYDNYHNEIDDGNLDFFINKEYDNDMKSVGNGGVILEKINYLKKPIKEMNKDDQDKVIKYMQNLCKLCNLYN